ncbi:MAG: 3-phosphoshikimate 1-carboxyvinyltransferase [Terriglobia bacterium]
MPELAEPRAILPSGPLTGIVRLPGDKSISHRYAMLGAVAEGVTEISGFASSADCQSTLDCLRALGVRIQRDGSAVSIEGRGLDGLSASAKPLDAGNSGSTMRMLAGILAGQPFSSRLTGDASLSRRPMKRILEPLALMAAHITSAAGGLPPLDIEGRVLDPIRYQPPVASAQVKTAVLFAGLRVRGATSIYEPVPTRDHTEIALMEMGAALTRKGGLTTLSGPARLTSLQANVPGDISSAAFFLAAALLVPGSNLILENVGLNPTRSAVVRVLVGMGGEIKTLNTRRAHGEEVGDVEVRHSALEGGEIPLEVIPNLIDELPVLAVLGTQTHSGVSFHGAGELRVKESDRLAAVAQNLRRLGAKVEEFQDGLQVAGQQRLSGAEVDSFGDHRIAMAFAVAGLVARGGVSIRDAGYVKISFPEFFDMLDQARRPP